MSPKCAMDKECSIADEMAKMTHRLLWVDIAREITRNLIGLVTVPGIIYLLYKFVEMAPPDDKMNIMLLVIGYLGGLATGICTWYFGGAMRSAVQQALTQTRGGTPNVTESPPNASVEVPVVPTVIGVGTGLSPESKSTAGKPTPGPVG